MNDSTQRQLLGYLLGALDDAEQQRVDERVEYDRECCEGLTQWRRRLAPLEAVRPDFEPPPGLAARTCRFVASYIPRRADVLASRWKMSPDQTPPSRASRFTWSDVAVVALLLITATATLLPAIYSSRFQSRVAACQNGLQQFGASLAQYSHQRGDSLSRLANNGRLTSAGVAATGWFKDSFLAANERTICPDAWLATQGVVPVSLPARGRIVDLRQSPKAQTWNVSYCPGTWQDGTANGPPLPPPQADMPLLADAPSANLPGQTLASHGGRGRNVWFEDGHGTFEPSPASHDMVDCVLSGGNIPLTGGISAPIIFVNGR
jgi:hypothetical protein